MSIRIEIPTIRNPYDNLCQNGQNRQNAHFLISRQKYFWHTKIAQFLVSKTRYRLLKPFRRVVGPFRSPLEAPVTPKTTFRQFGQKCHIF